jgi:hypothetical protein
MRDHSHDRRRGNAARAEIAIAVSISLFAMGCATATAKIQPAPDLQRLSDGGNRIVLVGQPGELKNESERLLRGLGSVEQRADVAGGGLRTACSGDTDLVVRLSQLEPLFVSNAPDRNALFLYETAVIVGIPVTLISAVAWSWYGDLSAKGDIETLWCAEDAPSKVAGMQSVRASGAGFIQTAELRRQLEPQLGVAMARRLVEMAAQCGSFRKGGFQCHDGK